MKFTDKISHSNLILIFAFVIFASQILNAQNFVHSDSIKILNYFENQIPKEIFSKDFGKIEIDSWEFDKTDSGKIILSGKAFKNFLQNEEINLGIWPFDYSFENLKSLKDKFGFSGVFVTTKDQYETAIKAGFEAKNLMLNIAFDKGSEIYKDRILNFDAGIYYIDEAVNHACFGNKNKRLYEIEELIAVKNFLLENRKNSIFVSSGYKRCGHLDSLAKIVDGIMYSAYGNWYNSHFGPCVTGMNWGAKYEEQWWKGGKDQFPSWQDMKSRYGEKFFQTWINTYEISEYENHFRNAQKLNLRNIWVYGFMSNATTPAPHHSDKFPEISEAAFKSGFLKKVFTSFKIEMKKDKSKFQNSKRMKDKISNREIYKIEKIIPLSDFEIISNFTEPPEKLE